MSRVVWRVLRCPCDVAWRAMWCVEGIVGAVRLANRNPPHHQQVSTAVCACIQWGGGSSGGALSGLAARRPYD